MNLGDLIEDARDHDTDIARIREILSVLKNFNAPLYNLMGNHDLRTIEPQEFAGLLGYDTPTFSVDIKGYHFVFLNGAEKVPTCEYKEMSADDITWLKNDLAKNKLPCLVFIHYGLAEDDMNGNWWFEAIPEYALLQNRKEVKAILEKDKNLLGCFCGHQHWTKQITENGVKYYMVGSLTEDMNFDGIADGVYFEVDIDTKNKMTVKTHRLFNRPSALPFL